MITSVSNEKIKFARGLARKHARIAAGQFLLEGTRLIQEATGAGFIPALVLYERAAFDTDARLRALVVALQKQTRQVYEVNATVMRALAETETPQGIAAVFPTPSLPPPSPAPRVLILDRIRDPGNLGTILRTAWAANVDSVLLAPETADAFNPKVVRAAMGAHFHVPITAASWQAIARRVETMPRVYLADAAGEIIYTRADWSPPVALMISNEAEGASDEARRLATATISIPMSGTAESLNAAIAAGILLFEQVRV
ncbi:MAG: RNA methyltransferase [Chloroflexi bacterium]|nr:RNA methyltransferase [Chloroflexota bacterium]